MRIWQKMEEVRDARDGRASTVDGEKGIMEGLQVSNYFISTGDRPYHLSVGAVVLNDHSEVLCHHFPILKVEKLTATDLFLLIRETLELGETLETAIHRGLREEAGVKAKIETYLGSHVSMFPRQEKVLQKTTLYFLCRLEKIDTTKRDPNDPEASSEILFLPIDVLIEKMKAQAARYGRTDLDEATVLERVKTLNRP